MATLKFDSKSYNVDHAVKGTDYVHGYDADGNVVISIDGISDFSVVNYSGTYINPEDCITEGCNDLKYCDGKVKTKNGREVPASAVGARPDTWTPTAAQVGAAQMFSETIELRVNDWANNQQAVLSDCCYERCTTFIVSPSPEAENYETYNEYGVRCIRDDGQGLYFVCDDAPSIDLVVNVIGFR